MLRDGGNAADALIAAQAVLTVIAPEACGLGGDAFVLLRSRTGVQAINGAGPIPAKAELVESDGARSITVPGLVDTWGKLENKGQLGLAACLQPAIALAREGSRVTSGTIAARDAQYNRLQSGGCGEWSLMTAAEGTRLVQTALAETLDRIATHGRDGFYDGPIADAIVRTVQTGGGWMTQADLAEPAAEELSSLAFRFGGHTIHVQPPLSQGVLLAMVLGNFEAAGYASLSDRFDHIGVELNKAAFELRDEIAQGSALLDRRLEIDLSSASKAKGPRAYLHTAGVAAADRAGNVASSLVSVFDDFGSGVFVPEGGFVLNNRGGGFTKGSNAFTPGKRPVHTLAPVIVETGQDCVAMSTPGADGQVQTLTQVLIEWLVGGKDLAEAVAAPRWRGEDGKLLLEKGHHARGELEKAGHDIVNLTAGDMRFGALAVAGSSHATPFALADWRRLSWAGVI